MASSDKRKRKAAAKRNSGAFAKAVSRTKRSSKLEGFQIDGITRDGPTPEYRRHHAVVTRSGGTGGQRHYSKLEEQLDRDAITPAQFYAGWRFGKAFREGVVGRGGSCLSFSTGSTGIRQASMDRIDDTTEWREAAEYLNSLKSLARPGRGQASDYLVMFVVLDASIEEMRDAMGYEDWQAARTRIVRFLEALEAYYKDVDRAGGRDRTPHTKAAAKRLLEPDDRRLPERGSAA